MNLAIDITHVNGFLESFKNARRFVLLYLVFHPTCADLKRSTLALLSQSY